MRGCHGRLRPGCEAGVVTAIVPDGPAFVYPAPGAAEVNRCNGQPRPKERRRVSIPAELRDSLKEVWELIRRASHDPDIALDYDDSIQVGAVCGGRVGKGSRPYALTYYSSGDTQRGRWFLALHPTEIEDIADGRLTEIVMHCCTAPECRCKFREADGLCCYCDYVPDREYAHLGVGAACPAWRGWGSGV